MQIIISAILTEEQALILAKRMGYNENINISLDAITNEIVLNPQTPWEFIKEVYEKMIANDTTKHFIAYNDEKNQAIWDTEDQVIRDTIQASITSQVI